MNIIQVTKQLKDKFSQVKNVALEKENNALFLKVEVEEKTLKQITQISKTISTFLDQIVKSSTPYFLDVFSTKKDMSIDKKTISNYLNSNLEVFLKKEIKEKSVFKGKLLEINGNQILLLWNAKGQFRKQIIEMENILKIELLI